MSSAAYATSACAHFHVKSVLKILHGRDGLVGFVIWAGLGSCYGVEGDGEGLWDGGDTDGGAEEVVVEGAVDADADHGSGRVFALDEGEAVYLGGVTVGAADGDGAGAVFALSGGFGFDEDVEFLADECAVMFEGDGLGEFHEAGVAALFGFFGQLGELGGWGAGLRGVGEGADVVEALFLDEVQEFLEFAFGFAGVADDEGGAEGDVRHGVPDVLDGLAGDAEAGTLHAVEDGVGAMLEGHVHVGDDVGEGGHGMGEAGGDAAGVGVHEADPRYVRDGFREAFEEGGEAISLAGIFAVGGGVLGDEDEFFDAGGGEPAGFVDEAFCGVGVHAAFDGGDDAEGAGTVAAV